jgi:hypothetical protein
MFIQIYWIILFVFVLQSGECGIPPLLVQRYAEELRLDVLSIALIFEQVRTLQLHALQRPSVSLCPYCNVMHLLVYSVKDGDICRGWPSGQGGALASRRSQVRIPAVAVN